jgi:hypothetical protein
LATELLQDGKASKEGDFKARTKGVEREMRKLSFILLLAVAVAFSCAVTTQGSEIEFTAQTILDAMAAQGAPLHNSTNQWGLWAVRVMPIVTGGGYTITGGSGSTTQAGWGVNAPGVFGQPPYTAADSAWFWDACGAEAGCPANPLYMIMDEPANTFTSYFGNTVTAVGANSFFDVFFDLDLGATWDGRFKFVVDGSKYTLGTQQHPGTWVQDFFGGYGSGGGLAHNMGAGYEATSIPEPGTLMLLGSGLIGAAGFIRRKIAG